MNKRTLLVAVFLAGIIAPSIGAEVHVLRERGNTLVEAEDFSAVAKQEPRDEHCEKCSGQRNLGYFWKDSWFEIEVQAASSCEYSVSLRVSSLDGSSIELLEMNEDPQKVRRLGILKAPNTRAWTNYKISDVIKVSLAAGTHTLRFKNLGDGTNIDFITFSAESNEAMATIYPPKNVGPDKNPLKGFGSGWWRPSEDFASVGFQYIEWGRLEPQDDQFDWKYVEEVLARDGTRGRHLILQFVVDWDYKEPVDENYVGPQWLLKKVGEHRGHATPGDSSSRAMRATKYDHPEYIREATEAIEALTGYFNKDPRVYILQAGLLGFWSEWHTFPRNDWSPSAETKNAILDVYMRNLPSDCFTQIRYPDEPAVKHQPGIGYTNGTATPTKHGYEFGQKIAAYSLWKNGPITGEWPPNVEPAYWTRFFLTDEGERFIEQARYSTLLMPEFKDIKKQLPSWTPDGSFISMHRQLGYNLQVERVRHVTTSDRHLHVEVVLGNVGIAPFYRDWEVQLAILADKSSEVVDLIKLETDLRELVPGSSTALKFKSAQKLDPTASYQIGLRVLQPGADKDKSNRWALDARNTFVVLANEVPVIDGEWNGRHALVGGWNVIGDTRADQRAELQFPFQGSARPVGHSHPIQDRQQWIDLLDSELSQWEVFMGVPHTSVAVDWPSKSESGTEGTPMGLNNDPLKVFSVKQIDGEPVLVVTGETYGGLTSRKEYENYHLSLQFKWGEKKWPPRANNKRDSGLLLHCVGQHGAFWNVWKRSLECQIQEGDCGDFIALAGSGCNIPVRRVDNSDRPQFDPTQPLYHGTGYVSHGPSKEKPNGQWNTIEVYSLGQTTVFVVNGTPNMVLERTVQNTPDGWKPLTKGQLQIQSEAAEIFYRDIKIRPITEFPESLRSITQPYEGKVDWFK